jgi:hypothetical protein
MLKNSTLQILICHEYITRMDAGMTSKCGFESYNSSEILNYGSKRAPNIDAASPRDVTYKDRSRTLQKYT